MKQNRFRLVFALVLVGTTQVPAQADPTPVRPDATFHLVSTTDLHGYLLEQTSLNKIKTGGVAIFSGYFNIAKASDPQTLFLDSGDLFQGTLVSNPYEGEPVIRYYNYVGYTAAALGNHDFDFGPVGPDTIVRAPGEDPQGALKAREQQAVFPFLGANICSVNEDKHVCTDPTTFDVASFASPYLIQSVNGVNVGIIGLSTLQTPDTTMRPNVTSLRFMPLDQTLKRFIPEMKAKGADAIVVIAHSGGFCKGSVCEADDEIFKLIDSLDDQTKSSISVLLGGHTHTYVNTFYNGVHVMIEGSYGRSFGYLTLTFHGADGSVTLDSHQSVDFCQQVHADTETCNRGQGALQAPSFLGKTVVPDAQAAALIQTEADAANSLGSQVIGSAANPLLKALPESGLGDMMADAFRFCYLDSTCSTPADIAFQNNGGIRSSQLSAGPVTYGEIFELMPFDNMITKISLTGAQVHDLLTLWYQHGLAFPQVSGIQIAYIAETDTQRTITNQLGQSETLNDPIQTILMSDGKPINDSQVYTVIMADFLTSGGEGLDFITASLNPAPVINYSRTLRDSIVDYVKLKSPTGLNYPSNDGRLNPQSESSAN